MQAWTEKDVPDQSGRTAIVTGANTGIGFETARMLAEKGAYVVLACRNLDKANDAVARIKSAHPHASVVAMALDLSDLDSVEAFANAFSRGHDRLDLLINNAGVMVPPESKTKQGFELQFGTNHLGHFALTARLLPILDKTSGSRVVVVSSTAANFGKIAFDDLNWEERKYNAFRAYGQSKLANSLFALELQRRLARAGSKVIVTGAHPGWTATDLQRTSNARFFNSLFAMKPKDGAMPTMRAATALDAESGSYFGPAHFFQMNGPPVRVPFTKDAQDESVAKRLFDESEKLARVSFVLSKPSEARHISAS